MSRRSLLSIRIEQARIRLRNKEGKGTRTNDLDSQRNNISSEIPAPWRRCWCKVAVGGMDVTTNRWIRSGGASGSKVGETGRETIDQELPKAATVSYVCLSIEC